MTANTEQERADFEAWLPNAYRQPQEVYTVHNMEVAFIAGMQAARRAQVVPQSVIDKIVPAIDPEGLCEEKHHCEWALYKDRERIRRELAAAPQPPEAAPVQMPEPAGRTTSHDGEFYWDNHLASQESRFGAKLYTEHQVRQLLADHGVK